jgi:hypothetical protein
MVAKRIKAIAVDYEDPNDHQTLQPRSRASAG